MVFHSLMTHYTGNGQRGTVLHYFKSARAARYAERAFVPDLVRVKTRRPNRLVVVFFRALVGDSHSLDWAIDLLQLNSIAGGVSESDRTDSRHSW